VNNKTPSVLGLFPRFSSDHLGGIQESARVAWQAISNAAETELICYARKNGNQSFDESGDGSRVTAIFSAASKQRSPDIVLIWQAGLIKLLPFLRSNPHRTALFLHGIEVWRNPNWLTRRLTQSVDLFLSNSLHTWNRFISYNPSLASVPHQIIPLGINTPVSSVTMDPAGPIALMLSRLLKCEDYKGHREVIGAWPTVLQSQPEAELWIAGDGNLKPELEQIVRTAGLESKIKFLGEITEERKQQLLTGSRCLVMPSRGEGFGLVYLEAMRLGRPCLVSTLDAGREVVNPPEAGLAVDPNNREGLARALNRLLSPGQEWTRWSEQARCRYEGNFTAKHFQDRLLRALFKPEVTLGTEAYV
jgi:phosphatidyl-myo-inositol dimannoside synthase